jgi:hypothetical protein
LPARVANFPVTRRPFPFRLAFSAKVIPLSYAHVPIRSCNFTPVGNEPARS